LLRQNYLILRRSVNVSVSMVGKFL
jgi:hypothetical protein